MVCQQVEYNNLRIPHHENVLSTSTCCRIQNKKPKILTHGKMHEMAYQVINRLLCEQNKRHNYLTRYKIGSIAGYLWNKVKLIQVGG